MNKWIASQYNGCKIIFLWSETPFYPGSEREVGPIDLPLQRNPLTNIPYVRASSLKGALRSFYTLSLSKDPNKDTIISTIFGTKKIAANYIFLDAEILIFPVRSDLYSFIYFTSKSQIALLNRALSYLGLSDDYPFLNRLENMRDDENLISDGSNLPEELTVLDGEEVITNIRKNVDAKLLVEFLVEKALPKDSKTREPLPGYGFLQNKIRNNLVILGNDSMFQNLVEKGIIRTVRIAIDYDTKVTRPGALFYQELIPQYTLLFSVLFRSIRFDESMLEKNSRIFERDLQRGLLINVGGDESTGKGVIRVFSVLI